MYLYASVLSIRRIGIHVNALTYLRNKISTYLLFINDVSVEACMHYA